MSVSSAKEVHLKSLSKLRPTSPVKIKLFYFQIFPKVGEGPGKECVSTLKLD